MRTLADLIAFNDQHAAEEMPYFGQELFLRAQDAGSLADAAYQTALARNHRLSREEGIDAALRRHRLDALVLPTTNPPTKIDLVNGSWSLGSSSRPAAMAGYPAITVPAGFARGLPVGVTFIGAAFSEPTLIRLAYAFEQASQARRPPTFAPTAAV
jgi:amidase